MVSLEEMESVVGSKRTSSEDSVGTSEVITIDGREIGTYQSPFVIAELSANHRGSKAAALEVIAAAADAGADAIKLQHYTPDTITVRSSHPDFVVSGGTVWDNRQLYDLYAEGSMPWEWTEELAAEARRRGLIWFSSPFDHTAIEFLEVLDVPALKIASFELVDLPLIRRAASTGKPLIMSTGMASIDEINEAVAAATESGSGGLALLRCNSSYPAPSADMDLRSIDAMRELWPFPIGLSDHTVSSVAAVAAVALGACIVEKHLTLRRSDGGPDASFSLEPDEFSNLVVSVREAHAALGSVRFGPSPQEVASVRFRPSLRAVAHIPAGGVITSDNVRSIRPAGGLAPDEFVRIEGGVARRALEPGDPITSEVLL